MGYTTEFEGRFTVTPPLRLEHAAYLLKFSNGRRVQRDEKKTAELPDPEREAVGLLVGPEGAFYVGDDAARTGVVNYNRPPKGQPGLWCNWAPTSDGSGLEWNGAEKFYHFEEWLEYLTDQFLTPWGYEVSGSVSWVGEEGEAGILEARSRLAPTSAGRRDSALRRFLRRFVS